MSISGLDKILNRSVKYRLAPYLLSPKDYWGYIYVEQQHHRSWAFKFLLIDCIIFAGLLTILLTYEVNYIWIGFLGLIFVGSAILNSIYAVSSKTTKRWWLSLIVVALFIFFFSIWFILINDAAIILIYLSLSHLVALIKARKQIN